MRVLVTGKNGQLAQCIKQHNPDWTFVDRDEFDITNIESVIKYIQSVEKFDICINTAAFTKVDDSEDIYNKENWLVNSDCLGPFADEMCKNGIFLIHISSDYVYGNQNIDELNEDLTNLKPLNEYGKAKLEGEKKVLSFSKNSIVLRTSWLYSHLGSNFYKTINKLLIAKEEIKVVNDQIGSPTNCNDFAKDLKIICNKLKENEYKLINTNRVYNYSNIGKGSWLDFSLLIKENFSGVSNCQILPVNTIDYPVKAKRQLNSKLSKVKIIKDFGLNIKDWKESFDDMIRANTD
ncbi:MAG: SDR family oxidoreductase [Patescibacteria group bacterium]